MPDLRSGTWIFGIDLDGESTFDHIDFLPGATSGQTNPPSHAHSPRWNLSGLAIVAVMQAAKYRLGDHWSQARSLDRPWHRRILSKPKMRQRSVVVGQVLLQHSTQMPFVQNNHMDHANRAPT